MHRNAGIEKNSIQALQCVATRVQIILYALPVATQRRQLRYAHSCVYCEPALSLHRLRSLWTDSTGTESVQATCIHSHTVYTLVCYHHSNKITCKQPVDLHKQKTQ